MANNDYFNILNTITLNNIEMKDIFSRYDIFNDTENYIEYKIKDGDTLLSISKLFYGTTSLYWIIQLYNDIIDPFYDFPLSEDELRDYILKYLDENGETGETYLEYYSDLYELNESKRTIKILDPGLIVNVLDQFREEINKIS